MSGTNLNSVDPALNSYVLMLLRSAPIAGIDDKSKPVVRATHFLSRFFDAMGVPDVMSQRCFSKHNAHGAPSLQSKLSVLVEKVQQLSAMGDKHAKVLQALLCRICMNGYTPWNVLVPFFDAAYNQEGTPKAARVLHYLIGTILSCGSAGAPSALQAPVRRLRPLDLAPQLCRRRGDDESVVLHASRSSPLDIVQIGAGTPVPLLPAAGTTFTELAVDALPFPSYAPAWAIIGDAEQLTSAATRLALRQLTGATRCALTTLPAGNVNDAKAAQLLQDLKASIDLMLTAETREHKSKKRAEAEVRFSHRAPAVLLSCGAAAGTRA